MTRIWSVWRISSSRHFARNDFQFTRRLELDNLLDELAQIIDRAVEFGESLGDFDAHARLGSLWAMRANRPTAPSHAIYTPMLCVMAQGAKQITLGAQNLVYNRGRFLLNSVALPASGQVIEATPHCPCLWIMLELDAATITSVIVESGLMIPAGGAPLARDGNARD